MGAILLREDVWNFPGRKETFTHRHPRVCECRHGAWASEGVGCGGQGRRWQRLPIEAGRSRWTGVGVERAEEVQMVAGISCRSKESGLAPRAPHLVCWEGMVC